MKKLPFICSCEFICFLKYKYEKKKCEQLFLSEKQSKHNLSNNFFVSLSHVFFYNFLVNLFDYFQGVFCHLFQSFFKHILTQIKAEWSRDSGRY